MSADELRFRDATEADLPRVVALLHDDGIGKSREVVADPLPAAYGAALGRMQRQEGNHLVVATLDGEVVGCMQLTLIPGVSRLGATRLQIEGVRVAARLQGSGVGRRMFEYAIQWGRERGCALVQLTTDARRADAHRFYESLGFTPSHVGMKLTLD